MGAAALAVDAGDESEDEWEKIEGTEEWQSDEEEETEGIERAMAAREELDPRTLEEARQSHDWPAWDAAVKIELDNLRAHDTYDLVELPDGANAIGSKIVFRRKRDAEGNVIQHKARIVAQGFTQIPGRDFDETFAPVARLSSIRTILALAARNDWDVIQMDVKSAYLNGSLDETIYMRQPPGSATPGQEHLVCKLKKTLYGLKQAGRGWYKTFYAAMTDLGFTRCAADHAVFRKRDGALALNVASNVDDLTIAGNREIVSWFADAISKRFEMSKSGEISWILGIEIRRDRKNGTIAASQRSQIDAVVERYNMEGAKPVTTPLQPGERLTRDQAPTTPRQYEQMRNVPYQEGVGSLMYLAQGTRPDIAFAVMKLAQQMQNPGPAHWEALKRVIRYLKHTRELWLVWGDTRDGLQGFSDADWGSSTDFRHSVSGYVFTLGSGAISWSAKKQNVVALSSTEAEYIALAHATKEAFWLRYMFSDLVDSDVLNYPVLINCDNRSAIALAKDNTYHPRTKHIDIRFHFIREAVEDAKIKLAYCPTEDMPADLFTKALARPRLEHLQARFGLRPL